MMDIEIDDGDTGQAMRCQRMGRTDRDIIEAAESHRPPPFGMVSRGAHIAERVEVLSHNHNMLKLMARMGFAAKPRNEDPGIIKVSKAL